MPKLFPFCTMLTFLICCSSDNPVSILETYHTDIEDVRNEIQLLRDLPFLTPVKIGVTSREEYADDNNAYSYAHDLMIAYKQIGFLPDTMKNLKSYLKSYYSGFPAAYYISGTDSITIVDPSRYHIRGFKAILAHEFTHALQDQHFNIGGNPNFPYQSTSRYNSDFYAARKCMVEGDAKAAEFLYYYENLSAKGLVDTTNKVLDAYMKSVNTYEFPGYLRVRSNFPYRAGAAYVAKVYQKGGWRSVDSLFHINRLLSTAEVLTGEQVVPTAFDVSNILKNWFDSSLSIQFADDDNYGPVMLMALLGEYVNSSYSNFKRAFGWRGDRLIYMRSNNKSWGKMVWSLDFKEDTDAIYIMNGFDWILSRRKLNGISSNRTVISTDSLIEFSTGNVKTSLIRSGKFVFWIENVDNAAMIVSDLTNRTLAKQSVSGRHIEVSPEVIAIKKAIIDRVVLSEERVF